MGDQEVYSLNVIIDDVILALHSSDSLCIAKQVGSYLNSRIHITYLTDSGEWTIRRRLPGRRSGAQGRSAAVASQQLLSVDRRISRVPHHSLWQRRHGV